MLLPQFIIKLLISIIVFAALLFFITKVINFIFSSQEEEKAKITLERIKLTLQKASTNENKKESCLLFPIKGWSIVFIPSNINKLNNFEKSEMYSGYDVVCICKKKCKYCFPYKQIIDEKNNYLNVDLNSIKSIIFFDKENYVLFTINKEKIQPVKLTKKEKEEFKKIIESNQDIHQMILEKARENGVQENIIIGIVMVESNFNPEAVSSGGAVGLMQLAPSTALYYGLKVAMINPNNQRETITFIKKGNNLIIIKNGEEESILIEDSLHNTYIKYMEKENLWTECEGKKISPCNRCNKEYCSKKEDERFNPEKNLDAGIKHFKSLLEEFKNYDYALAAYNIGAGKIKKLCCENNVCNKELKECVNDENVIKYVEKIISIAEQYEPKIA